MPSFTTVLASIAVFCHFADAKLQTRIPTVPIAKPYHETPVNRGAHHLARAYARYGVPVSDALKRSASQTGAVTSTNGGNDTYWVNPVNIDGQVLNLIFDTGSSDLWVFSDLLSTEQSHNHTVFSPSKSKHWKPLPNETWETDYGDGSFAYGTVGLDVVDIGGAVFNAQAVEIATNVSGEFMNLHSDGLVGLGFTNGNTVTPDEQKTFLDNIAPQLEKPLMAVVLNHDGAGHFDFGFLDEKYYQGKIWYADVDESTSFWTFNGTGYAIEGEKFHTTTLSFIMDTGTSIILLTDDITIPYYQKVHGAVNSTQGYVFPCDAKLPSITIRIGTGGHFTVPSEYLNFGPVSSASTTVLNGDLTKESGHGRPGNNGTQELCYGAIQSSQDQGEDGLNILGDAFIKAFFVVFGMNGPQIGVAHRKKLS